MVGDTLRPEVVDEGGPAVRGVAEADGPVAGDVLAEASSQVWLGPATGEPCLVELGGEFVDLGKSFGGVGAFVPGVTAVELSLDLGLGRFGWSHAGADHCLEGEDPVGFAVDVLFVEFQVFEPGLFLGRQWGVVGVEDVDLGCGRCPAVVEVVGWLVVVRQVRRGEKAIRVLGPVTKRVPVLDDAGNPLLDSEGKPREIRKLVGVTPVSVFDIAQTDGPPPPEHPVPVLLTGQAPPGLWDSPPAFA